MPATTSDSTGRLIVGVRREGRKAERRRDFVLAFAFSPLPLSSVPGYFLAFCLSPLGCTRYHSAPKAFES